MADNKLPGGPQQILTIPRGRHVSEQVPGPLRNYDLDTLEAHRHMARGDRLGVERTFVGGLVAYQHLGIDLGDGTVVHARPDDFRKPFEGGRVVRTPCEEFADGRTVVIVTEPPAAHTPEEVARRAEAHVGRDGYCPVVANCEHFATWCATGRHRSRQLEAAIALAAVAALWVGGTVARVALAGRRSASA